MVRCRVGGVLRAARGVAARALARATTFVASALWPDDWRLGPRAAPALALPATRCARRRASRLDAGAARARETTFAARTLWQRRDRTPRGPGKPLVAFIVNGAQGDDDEAHGGHFSIATGRVADDGDIGAWLVDSFYSLDVVSEKGILAAPVPLDRYQGDLNSGQAWYRPSWALVAVLDDERAAVRVQSALGRVFRHFWRGQLAYYHPTDNCTSIAVDTLRALGLDVPLARSLRARRAPGSALPWLIVRERSLAKAKFAFDYLVTERTRLLPALALEAVFEALLALAHAAARSRGGPLGARTRARPRRRSRGCACRSFRRAARGAPRRPSRSTTTARACRSIRRSARSSRCRPACCPRPCATTTCCRRCRTRPTSPCAGGRWRRWRSPR